MTDPYLKRLQDLTTRLDDVQELLNEIDTQISFSTDEPIKRAKLKNDRKKVKEDYGGLLEEYEELNARINSSAAPPQGAESELTEISHKIDGLAEQLKDYQAAILARFDKSDQAVIGSIVAQLTSQQQASVDTVLKSLERNSIPSAEAASILQEIQQNVAIIQKQISEQPSKKSEDLEAAAIIIEDPKLDVDHRLLVTIPIIPFILSYEGEIELNVSGNIQTAYNKLKAAWERIKNHPQPPSRP